VNELLWGKAQRPGLPEGFFSDQKSHFGHILEDLGMENVVINSGHFGIFCDHWVYFMGIGGNLLVVRYVFPRFGIL
jgi:hypothetical protein